MQYEKGTKIIWEKPWSWVHEAGKNKMLFFEAWLSWGPQEDGEISENYGFPSGWPSTGLNKNIAGDTWII